MSAGVGERSDPDEARTRATASNRRWERQRANRKIGDGGNAHAGQLNAGLRAVDRHRIAETDGGAVSTGNGGVGGGAINGKYQEIGVWAVYNF